MQALLTLDRRGGISLPPKLHSALGLKANDQLIAEMTPDGLLFFFNDTATTEIYTEERIREFEEGEAELAAFFARLDAKR